MNMSLEKDEEEKVASPSNFGKLIEISEDEEARDDVLLKSRKHKKNNKIKKSKSDNNKPKCSNSELYAEKKESKQSLIEI